MPLPILLLQVATAVTVGASAGPQITATRYEFTTVSESESGGAEPIRATGRVTATRSGSMLRYEVTPTPIQLKLDKDDHVQTFPVINPYTLIFDAGRIYSVDTVKREYFLLDQKSLANTVSDAMIGFEALDFRVTDTKFDVTDMGDGEPVASHPTRRWRVTGAATLAMSVAGQTDAVTVEELTDYYYASDFTMPVIQTMVPDTSAASGAFAAIMGREHARKVAEEYSKLPRSTPIKTVTRMSFAAGIMDVASTETMELSSIQTISVPASYFELPKGFKKVDMPLPEMPIPPTGKQ
jgi:hypothetical protein